MIKIINESVNWDYFDKYQDIISTYMPDRGEGDNKASQLVTAINKLIYKWYNDGDVYDNRYGMDGWCNDLSSYANWIHNNYSESVGILDQIMDTYTDSAYENILKELADTFFNEKFLSEEAKKPTVGSIYDETGPYEFDDSMDEEDEYEDYDEEEY